MKFGFSENKPCSGRQAYICIPPALAQEVMEKSQEDPLPHPVWARVQQRNRYFVVTATSLDDLTEIADFARVELEEPEEPLTKARRNAFQTLLGRAHRYAVLEPLGDCHCLATEWRDQPLKGTKASSKIVRELRDAKRNKGLTLW